MGRKTIAAGAADTLDYASAEAARLLAGDLAILSTAMRDWLRVADQAKDPFDRAALLAEAMKLAHAAARTGDTIGKLKGERRQYISVERVADPDFMSPKSAPNSEALSTPFAKENAECEDSYPSE